ncbi:MAG: MipA/OmpV family protein [Fusobacteriaceae bacterium]
MKKLLFLNLFLSSVIFATNNIESDNNNNFAFGISGGITNSVYKIKDKQEHFFLPNLDVQYKGLFIQGDEVSYSFWGDEILSLSVTTEFFSGYPVKGKDLEEGYNNINNRKSQIMTGLSLDYTFLKNNFVSLSNVFGKHGGKTSLSLLRAINLDNNIIFAPSIYGNIYSQNFSNYYFGVTSEEAQNNNNISNSFSINETYSAGIALALEKKFDNSFSLYTFGSYEFLSNKIKNSPIVKKDYFWTFGGGLKYTL